MVNRFTNLIDSWNALRILLGKTNKAKAKSSIMIEIRKIVWKIKHFGKREKAIRVVAQFWSSKDATDSEVQIREFYFTGIEPFEAIECVKYHTGDMFIQATATELPLGEPIKIS